MRDRRQTLRLLPLMVLVAAAVGVIAGWLTRPSLPDDNHVGRVMQPTPLKPFQLQRAAGGRFTQASLEGGWHLLFFGYTACPDVCPMTLDVLAQAVEKLGDRGLSPGVIFVSVDPDRDGGETLAAYAQYFDPRFVAATGTDAELSALLDQLGARYGRDPPDARGYYAVTHSSVVFVIDPNGAYHAALAMPMGAADVVQALAEIMSQWSA